MSALPDDSTLAKLIGGGRVAFGVGCLLAPRLVTRTTPIPGDGPLVWMVRIFGVRDLVLGAGALQSMSSPNPDVSWVRMGAIADSLDVVTALVFRKELGPSSLATTLAVAGPAAAGGWKATLGLSKQAATA